VISNQCLFDQRVELRIVESLPKIPLDFIVAKLRAVYADEFIYRGNLRLAIVGSDCATGEHSEDCDRQCAGR
jgi:hypothetical protein